jgi:hypothetical protein
MGNHHGRSSVVLQGVYEGLRATVRSQLPSVLGSPVRISGSYSAETSLDERLFASVPYLLLANFVLQGNTTSGQVRVCCSCAGTISIGALFLFVHLKSHSFANSWYLGFLIVTGPLLNALSSIFAVSSKVSSSNGCYSSVLSRAARLRFFVPRSILQMGFAVFECKALLEGLFSDDATFLTTPKAGAPTRAEPKWLDDLAAYSGLLLGLYQLAALSFRNLAEDMDSSIVRYTLLYTQVTHVTGLLCVPTWFLWKKYGSSFCWAQYKHATMKSIQFMNMPSRSLFTIAVTAVLAGGQIMVLDGAKMKKFE